MLRLQARDEAILVYLARRRAATMSQLQRKFFPSYRATARRTRDLVTDGLLTRHPLPLDDRWESVFSLSTKGRRLGAKMLDVDNVPSARIDIRIWHVLAVNEALDCLGLDGETEVAVGAVIADAVCPGPIYVEVDRGHGDLRKKARRYDRLGPLVIVTPRPKMAERAFRMHGNVVVVPDKMLGDARVGEALREELRSCQIDAV